jgi:hypothetical protein
VSDVVDRELARILKADHPNRYTTATLCDLLEGCPAIDLSASAIKRYLTKLKATKTTNAHRCYDRNRSSKGRDAAERWRWVEEAKAPFEPANGAT